MHVDTIRIPLPASLDEDEVAVTNYACLRLIGKELRILVDGTFAEHYGPQWPTTLQQTYGRGSRASANDLVLILKEVLHTGDRVGRQVLPRDREWLDAAARVLEIRNRTMHLGSVDAAIDDARTFTHFTSDAGLRCAAECAAFLDRMLRMRAGTFVPPAAAERESRAASEAREAALTDLLTQREADLLERDRALASRDADLERALLEGEAHRQRAAVLERERDDARRAATGQVNAEATSALVRPVGHEASGDLASVATSSTTRSRIEEIRAQLLSLRASVETPRPPTIPTTPAWDASGDPAKGADPGGLPSPGQTWPYAVGRDRWTLSKRFRTLTANHDGTDLSEMVADYRAVELIDQFLAIRPTGGKVFVDADLDAVTWMDGEWSYLGRFDEEIDDVVEPGATVTRPPQGREYRMTRGGVITRVDGADILADEVGVPVAEAVVNRVRVVKPEGGRLWVDSSTGRMTARAGRAAVVVTTVGPWEWFAEDLDGIRA